MRSNASRRYKIFAASEEMIRRVVHTRAAKRSSLLIIQYDMGPVPKGGLALGGSFVNQAAQRPQKDRLWIKEQTVGGRKVSVAYSKGGQLIISSASAAEGINFSTTAKTSEDVADALLMVLSLSEKKGEKQ